MLSIAFCSALGEAKIEIDKLLNKISQAIMGKSLIRKDLLYEKRTNLSPPVRNIFSPQRTRGPESGLSPEEIEGGAGEIESESGERALDGMPDIRYIGYVHSGHKIVGLIIYEEEALAVEEGEIISQDLRIGKVTAEEIELIGPNSQRRKYSLEGEQE
jgi:hypothetical protein